MDLAAHYAGRRVLVTGGLGFMGSALPTERVRVGARVTVLDSVVPDHRNADHDGGPVRGGADG